MFTARDNVACCDVSGQQFKTCDLSTVHLKLNQTGYCSQQQKKTFKQSKMFQYFAYSRLGNNENYRPLGAVDELMHYHLQAIVQQGVHSTPGRKFSLLPKKVCNSCTCILLREITLHG